jgi:hypothetical protein
VTLTHVMRVNHLTMVALEIVTLPWNCLPLQHASPLATKDIRCLAHRFALWETSHQPLAFLILAQQRLHLTMGASVIVQRC